MGTNNMIRGLLNFALSSLSWSTLYKMFRNPGTYIIGSVLASISSQIGLYYINDAMVDEFIVIDVNNKMRVNVNYFYQEIWPLILEKSFRYFCIVSGIYFGLLHVSTIITPYHISEKHFFVLSMQQNIAYIWYFIPGDYKMREDLFLVIVLLPLISYMIETHQNPEQHLKIQLSCLCAAYFIARICEAINKR